MFLIQRIEGPTRDACGFWDHHGDREIFQPAERRLVWCLIEADPEKKRTTTVATKIEWESNGPFRLPREWPTDAPRLPSYKVDFAVWHRLASMENPKMQRPR